MKLKPLLPSLKEKKRYLVYEIVSSNNFNFNKVKEAIDKENLRFLGELGLAKANIIHIQDCYKDNKGILRVNNKYINELKMSLALIKEIEKNKVKINTIYVSGILKKAKPYLKGGK